MQHRRVRALVIGSSLFALVVLATSMPVPDLLSQHGALSSTATRLGSVEAQNQALRREASELANPATEANIARRDYGLVSPGSQAYEVLPAAGSPVGAAQTSGHVPLNGPPVVPGSVRSQELLGAGAVSPVAPHGSANASRAGASAHRGPGTRTTGTRRPPQGITPRGGFWTRVVRTLEFWR